MLLYVSLVVFYEILMYFYVSFDVVCFHFGLIFMLRGCYVDANLSCLDVVLMLF